MLYQLNQIVNKPTFLIYVIIIYIVGLFGLSLTISQDLFIKIIPFNILLANFVLFLSIEDKSKILLLSLLGIGLAGFFLEVAGIATGQIFGVYDYGNTLGPKALKVPFLIGINWIFMVLCGVEIAKKITHNAILIPFISGCFMVMYDYFLEFFAIRFGMWIWYTNGIPLQNYVSWYFFGTLFSIFYYFLNRNNKIPIAIPLFIIQLLFFVILYLLN